MYAFAVERLAANFGSRVPRNAQNGGFFCHWSECACAVETCIQVWSLSTDVCGFCPGQLLFPCLNLVLSLINPASIRTNVKVLLSYSPSGTLHFLESRRLQPRGRAGRTGRSSSGQAVFQQPAKGCFFSRAKSAALFCTRQAVVSTAGFPRARRAATQDCRLSTLLPELTCR